jgi:hypothetical protein
MIFNQRRNTRMAISQGDKLPDAVLRRMGDDGPEETTIAALTAGRKNHLVWPAWRLYADVFIGPCSILYPNQRCLL